MTTLGPEEFSKIFHLKIQTLKKLNDQNDLVGNFAWPENLERNENEEKNLFYCKGGFFFSWLGSQFQLLSPKRNFVQTIGALAKFSNNVVA